MTAKNQPNNQTKTEQGTVKFFHRLKGWGFLTADKDGKELFVHYSAVEGEGYRNLYEDQRVSFTRHDAGKGPQARDVKVLGE